MITIEEVKWKMLQQKEAEIVITNKLRKQNFSHGSTQNISEISLKPKKNDLEL